MKNKKKLLVGLLLATMATAVGTAASCGKDDTTPVIDAGDAGVYYCDEAGQEYLMTLENNSFTLSLASDVAGSFKTDGNGNLTLTFADETKTTANAVLSNGVLTLQYNGETFTFLKRTVYTVSYEVNGGSAVKDASVVNGRTMVKPADPEKKGCSFVGWYKDSDFNNVFTFGADIITENTTLYARFATISVGESEYEANFVMADGTTAAEKVKTIGGVVYNLPVLKKADATFLGWWVSDYEDANKLTYQYTGQKLSANTTLFAVWSTEAPVASVSSTGINWTTKTANAAYSIVITMPDGTTKTANGSGNSYSYSFADKVAGDYTIAITVGTNTTMVFYKNKALTRVSLFNVVEPSILVFNGVENAEKYLITIDSGDPSQDHITIDNGSSTYYNFANCAMKKGGIVFTVEAVGTGYATSEKAVYTVDRSLDKITDLIVNTDTEQATWNQVENATAYIVKITEGENTYSFDVGSKTNFSLKEYAGDIKVEVYPTTKGYNSPEAAEVVYNKTRLASPSNISVAGTLVSWDEVEGAESYRVKIGGQVYTTSDTTLDLSVNNSYYTAGQSDYALSVQAVGSTEAVNSLYANAVDVKYMSMGALSYSSGKVSWAPVVGATEYLLKVNGKKTISVENEASAYAVTLTQSGVNTITVCYVDEEGTESTWSSISVIAKAISFDACGGEEAKTQYKAIGDDIELPETSAIGYDFGGWYNIRGGADNLGARYNDSIFRESGDTTLYAYWIPKSYSVSLNLSEIGTIESNTGTVKYKKTYSLPVPVADVENATKVFSGWYTSPNTQGIKYTDEKGKSLIAWSNTEDVVLYAGWLDVFEYTEKIDSVDATKKTYSVKAGLGIGYVNEVTVPTRYRDPSDKTKEYDITIVESGAFTSCTNLRAINIPESITTIEKTAFTGCTQLAEVNIYTVEGTKDENKRYYSVDGVLIHDYNKDGTGSDMGVALEYFPMAKTGSYTIPEGVQTIPGKIFDNAKITEIFIPASVNYVQTTAFNNCTILTTVVFMGLTDDDIENGLSEVALELQSGAFSSCKALTTITLPSRMNQFTGEDGVGTIFAACSSLTEVNVDGNTNYSSKDGVICSSDGTQILYCPVGRTGEFTIPNGVLTIQDSAFNGCTQLTGLTVPGAITYIGKLAFNSCSNIRFIDFKGTNEDNALEIGEQAFYNCSKLTSLILPANLTKLRQYAFGNTTKLTQVELKCEKKEDDEFIFEDGAFGSVKSSAIASCVFYIKEITIGENFPLVNISGVFGGQKIKSIILEGGANNATYTLTEDGILYDKEVKNLVFYPMTRLGDYILPDTIERIGAEVFRTRTNLSKITIGAKVSEIGDGAFFGCTKLQEVVFKPTEEGVEEIPLAIKSYAFRNCSALTTITLPKRVKSIDSYAFYDCSGLTSITLSEGLESIGDNAFYSCKSLSTVTIPASVSKIGSYADDGTLLDVSVFKSCKNLTNISVAEGSENYVSVDGVLYGKTEGVVTTLYAAPYAKAGQVEIPKTVNKIVKEAFANCRYLTDITFESGRADDLGLELGESAFYYCQSLKNMILPENITKISRQAFYYCTAIEKIYIPKTVVLIEPQAFYHAESLNNLEFEEGGTEDLVIESGWYWTTGSKPKKQYSSLYGVFIANNCLKSIVFPERMTFLGVYAFNNNTTIESVSFPSTFTTLEASSSTVANNFYGCKNLTSVTFAPGCKLQSIGPNAFYKSGLKSIVLPDSLTAIGNYAFEYNNKLESIQFPDSLKTINMYAFAYCNSLQSLTLASGITTIGNYAFAYCDALENLSMNANLTGTLGTYIFYKDEALTTLTFSNGNTTSKLGNYMFADCSSLQSVVIPNTVTSIGTYAFSNCNSLISATFEADSKLATIGAYAFQFTALTAFAFPEVDTSKQIVVNAGIFNGCEALTDVYLSMAVHGTNGMFNGCASVKNFTVAEGHQDFVVDTEKQIVFDPARTEIKYIYGRYIGEFVIPDGATNIASGAFAGQNKITKITIPSTVQQISDSAFKGCTALKEVVFEQNSNLSVLEERAFQYCTSLTSINLPNQLTTLNPYLFAGCSSLKTIQFPTDVTTFGENLFQDCTSLKSIAIPEGLNSLPNYLFSGCTALTSVSFSADSQLTEIGSYVFNKCSSLKGITLPDTVEKLGSYAFAASGLTSIVLPENITCLAEKATVEMKRWEGYCFYNCKDLESVQFLGEVETIGTYTFSGCDSLTELSLPSATVIANFAFAYSGLEKVSLPAVKDMGSSAFVHCEKLKDVELNDGLTLINGSTFAYCTSLETLTLPSNLNCLAPYAFEHSGIKNITIPASLTKLTGLTLDEVSITTGSTCFVFYYCHNLESVTFLGEVTHIGYGAFYFCDNLKEVLGLDHLKMLGGFSFYHAESLKEMDLPALTTIGSYAFQQCISLETVRLNDNLRSFDNDLFNGCSSLKNITLPSKLTYIAYSVFRDCVSLEKIVIPEGITYFGSSPDVPPSSTTTSYLFAGCTSLKEVVLPKKLYAIGGYTFQDCTSLTEIKLPEELAVMGSGVFYGCTGLTEITIPVGVDALGGSIPGEFVSSTNGFMFKGCSNLSTVNILGDLDFISASTFEDCTSLTSINLPKSVNYYGKQAFKNTGFTTFEIGANVETIEQGAFGHCNNLVAFTVQPGNINFSVADNGILYNADGGIQCYPSARPVEDGKFTLLSGVSVAEGAFAGCQTIEELILPSDMEIITMDMFYDFTGLKRVVLPNTLTTIFTYAFQECPNLDTIVIPNSVKTIGDGAFQGSGIKTIVIPNSVESVGIYAFKQCPNLTSVVFEKGSPITFLKGNAFDGCSALKSVVLPEKLEQMGTYMFRDCISLESIEIPASLKYLAYTSLSYTPTTSSSMFQGCSSLKNVTFLGAPEMFGYGSFRDCISLESIVIPEGVKSIGSYCFAGCSSLKHISLPNSLETIVYNCFLDCTGLEEITIPKSIKNLAYSTGTYSTSSSSSIFSGCTSLRKVNFLGKIEVIGSYCFQDCTSLESINLDRTMVIGNYAFKNCTSLNSLVIPNTITSVGTNLFTGWTEDQTLYFEISHYDFDLWNWKDLVNASWKGIGDTAGKMQLVFDYKKS